MKASWIRVLIAAAVAVALAGTAAWFYQGRPVVEEPPQPEADLPPDPRLSYAGPFQNVHPSVRYVGDAKCAECHLDVALPYADHPMGRSLVAIAELADRQPYDKAHNSPFDALGARLWAERDGPRVRHRRARIDDGQAVWEVSNDVHFAVGSGTRGYSYFAELDGYVFQTPISWFSQKNRWDLSPGFDNVLWPGRLVPAACLQCHANGFKKREGGLDRFQAGVFDGHAIGCERCHGPGERHVRAREGDDRVGGGFDTTIVNPARLEGSLRENVCEQCHLGGVQRQLRRGRDWLDYRPGTALEDFFCVYVVNPDLASRTRAVGQVEQMHRSKCYQKGDPKARLGCISCHDPHRRPDGEEAVSHFRQRCLACHQTKGCTSPREARLAKRPDDSCVACHMPRVGAIDVAHTALTDHTIPRLPTSAPAGTSPRPDSLPYKSFHDVPAGPGQEERRRDQAVMQVWLAENALSVGARQAALVQAATALASRLRAAPTDPFGWEALARSLVLQGRLEEGLVAARRAHELMPQHYQVIALMAMLERDRGRADEAARLWAQAAEINPYEVSFRRFLTGQRMLRGDWAGSAPHAEAWVRLEPNSVEARRALTQALLGQGKRDEARRAFDGLRALKPRDLGELEAWYQRLAR
ncbi:MAG: multiheme c-type cytochrome [Gemmataceae bacterium]